MASLAFELLVVKASESLQIALVFGGAYGAHDLEEGINEGLWIASSTSLFGVEPFELPGCEEESQCVVLRGRGACEDSPLHPIIGESLTLYHATHAKSRARDETYRVSENPIRLPPLGFSCPIHLVRL